jgi:hypothetical protein
LNSLKRPLPVNIAVIGNGGYDTAGLPTLLASRSQDLGRAEELEQTHDHQQEDDYFLCPLRCLHSDCSLGYEDPSPSDTDVLI